ncbi:lipopolysaccharide biosynthesis protein [Pseudomonas sp. HS-18]|uniref:lipopolysaccharide biosynthesis protein n=1 Tax=Pseudomonas sp. HS-18 TaxID=2879114 RepID=UPI001CF03591|nr:oligosaccharide flippase family protein [Pseudomonas sp. HS-18]UCL88109.1 oligosaccharide flippase family protein [Pseudomonas sp. HS-18]
MKALASGYKPGRLARSAIITLFWQLVRIGLLALWMVVTARLLGPAGYGEYSGLASLAITLGAFTGLGLGLVMYQGSVHTPEKFSQYWSNSLACIVGSGTLITILFVALGSWLSPDSHLGTLIAIGISEAMLFPVVTNSAFAFSAHERMGWATVLPALTALLRLLGNLAFYLFSESRSLDQYVWFHACATLLAALAAATLTQRCLLPTRMPLRLDRAQLLEGIGFAFSWTGSNALTSLDKTFALRFGSAEIAGLYSIAYRFISILTQPVDALVSAALPRLFALGTDQSRHPSLIVTLVAVIITYGVLAGLFVWSIAAIIPLILGAEFTPAVQLIQLLAIVIPFYGFRAMVSQVLVGRRQKKTKSLIELAAIALMAMLSMILIPRHGAEGAAYAYVAVEAFLAVAVALAFLLTRAATSGNTHGRSA